VGKFVYDTTIRVDIEDRALAHLQSVIIMKLRRGEGFLFTWKEDLSTGSGRTSVWVHPRASLAFKFAGNRAPQLNRAWLQALSQTASSPRGLYLVPEPDSMPHEPLHQEMSFRVVDNDDLVVAG
jgi:hypothetical protein